MKDQSFFYRDRDMLKQLDVNTIVYIQAQGNYCIFYTAQKEQHYTIRISIETTIRLLPATRFARLNRSEVAAIHYIDYFKKDEVFLKEPNTSVLLTKQFYDLLLKKIVILYTKSNKHIKNEDEWLTQDELYERAMKKDAYYKKLYQKRKTAKEVRRQEQKTNSR